MSGCGILVHIKWNIVVYNWVYAKAGLGVAEGLLAQGPGMAEKE